MDPTTWRAHFGCLDILNSYLSDLKAFLHSTEARYPPGPLLIIQILSHLPTIRFEFELESDMGGKNARDICSCGLSGNVP